MVIIGQKVLVKVNNFAHKFLEKIANRRAVVIHWPAFSLVHM